MLFATVFFAFVNNFLRSVWLIVVKRIFSSEMSLYDSSGIGSLAPSAVSEKSRNSRKHASLAKKVRKSYPHTLTISYKGTNALLWKEKLFVDD